ncbi:TPA: hypothetical protein DCW38_07045 [candidate division WOR-3 bacterium]|uniref:Uncharacterized protein n=1 Tax=candidate division WOR-3 bacterium TaxID=2052148 RepID=A0A350HBK0_UNCW3|nr:hypothetical protein [candidate division WOR-3 bacterium]
MKEMKIEADFSVGMRGKIGFSNGFSKPYRLISGGPLEFPASFMDSAMVSEKKNENYPPEIIAEEIKNTSGVMTTIFHPSSLDRNTFCEYDGMLEEMISLSKINGMKNMCIKDMAEEFSGYPVLKGEGNILCLDKSCKTDIRLYCKEGIKMLKPDENFKI